MYNNNCKLLKSYREKEKFREVKREVNLILLNLILNHLYCLYLMKI